MSPVETKTSAHRTFHTSVVQPTVDKSKCFQNVIGRSLTINILHMIIHFATEFILFREKNKRTPDIKVMQQRKLAVIQTQR